MTVAHGGQVPVPGRLVVVHDVRARPGPVDDLVRVAVGELGLEDASGPVRHHCPTCGSSAHGRPWLATPAGAPALHVSIARCPGRSVVALTDAGPIGIDVEPSGAAGRDVVDGVIGSEPGDPTRHWVRAEAFVKAAGCGLARAGVDRADIGLAWTSDIDLGPDHEAAVAVLTSGAPEVRVIEAVAAAGSG